MELQLDLNKEYGIVLKAVEALGGRLPGGRVEGFEARLIRIKGVAGTSVGAPQRSADLHGRFSAERDLGEHRYSGDGCGRSPDGADEFQFENLPDLIA